jgi:B12-binding domain/radical SAM domain protein
VDGCLSLAGLLKQQHPETPIIVGGLSATYFRAEIMADHPCIDFVVCGDSTEEPLRLLLAAIRRGDGFAAVPNLVWRDQGRVVDNGISWQPESLDHVRFDYTHIFRMMARHRDPEGYLPYAGWLANPVLAVFSCRGCRYDCAPCGGSRTAFQTNCRRPRPAFRSPGLLAQDIADIAAYTGAPIMVIGDLLQPGEGYAETFFRALRAARIDNELAFEFFRPPPPRLIELMAGCLDRFNVELSPESHDPLVRRAFGRDFDNRELEEAIDLLLATPCRRIDLFLLVGLPRQSYDSVMASVDWCGELLDRSNGSGRLLPMLAPLAPFVDPGSRVFEHPEESGYRIFHRTLAEHRRAMLLPSWKERLNYETAWMTRDEIVAATYDGAARLVGHKERHGLVTGDEAAAIRDHIARSRDLIARLDEGGDRDADLADEIRDLNRLDTLCGKHELDWPVIGRRLHLLRGIAALTRRS